MKSIVFVLKQNPISTHAVMHEITEWSINRIAFQCKKNLLCWQMNGQIWAEIIGVIVKPGYEQHIADIHMKILRFRTLFVYHLPQTAYLSI